MLADYELQGGDEFNAITDYMRGLKKDSLMNYARLNLAATYNSIDKNQDALKTLKEALAIDQTNDRIYYNLGLLYYELTDIPSATENFKKAAQLGSLNPGLYYNYGLLLQQQKKVKEAEAILLKGFSINPQALNINYALCYLYMSQKATQKARKHALILRATAPSNPEYQRIFKSLGL